MMSSPSEGAESLTFGTAWPDLNDGLFYNDVVRLSDSGPSFFLLFYFHIYIYIYIYFNLFGCRENSKENCLIVSFICNLQS